jgi:hypothetical protein
MRLRVMNFRSPPTGYAASKSGGSDAARRSLACAVRHQAILRIRLFQKIIESKAL